jgi:hypothetical protein
MATKTKKFDAVAASRNWKQAVGQKTATMSRTAVLAFFDRDQALATMQSWRKKTSRALAVR